jgi:hypothetical protein
MTSSVPLPQLTHLILFNPKLEHTPEIHSHDSDIDKEDWDEASQVLFAKGQGWKDTQGKVQWNSILKQMGLVKGLMGFMR